LDVECDTSPIRGSLRDDRGTSSGFVGWMQLITALQAALAPPPQAMPDAERRGN
jgi:hypothetical protein